MKINKFISAVLSVSLCLASAVPAAFAGFSDVEDSKAIEVITGLGIMHGDTDGTFSPEVNLTRAEFAQIVADIYTYGTEIDATVEWKENFFEGVFEAETELIPPEEMNQTVSELYSDVQEGNEYYKAIELVTYKKVMNGIGNGEFGPDGNLTIEQTLKVILSMMGYGNRAKSLGGYPVGYSAVATELDILDNVKSSNNEYATKEDVANILYNVLDIPLMQYKMVDGKWNYLSYEDDTFLSKILDMGYDRGRMTSNGYTNLTGEDSLGKSFVTINNVLYKVNAETEYVRDYIGRDVEVYYPLSEDSQEFVYACLSGKDEVTKFDISDFVDYKNGKITYTDQDKDKNINLISAPFMIENNSAVSSFDNTIFDFNYGTVEIIQTAKGSEADLIILKRYQNFNVELLDMTNETIYSSTSLVDTELDLGDEDKDIVIYDEAGNKVGIEALVNGTVTSVCNGKKKMEIFVSTAVKKNVTVKSIATTEKGEYTLYDGKKSYIISKDYIDKGGALPKLNSVYDFKLDIFGNIVHIREVAGNINIAFVNTIKKITDNDTGNWNIMLKYYDPDQKTMNTTYLADRVKIVNTDDTVKSYSMENKAEEVYDIIYAAASDIVDGAEKVIGSMVRYTMNEEGEINWIELPGIMENSLDDSSRLVEIPRVVPRDDSEASIKSSKLYAARYYGGNAIIPNTAKVIQCNYNSDKFREISGYSVGKNNVFSDGKTYELKVYATVKNSPVAEYVIYYSEPAMTIDTKAPQTCGVVIDNYVAWDENDEEIKNTLILDKGEYVVEEGTLDAGNVKNVQGDSSYTDGNGKAHDFTVEKGDIIRYGMNAEGEINTVQLLYDANADYSEGVTVNGTVYDGWSENGNLAGTIDGFIEGLHKYTNPYVAKNMGTSETTFITTPYEWTVYDDNMRVMAGSVMRAGSNYLVTTTRNMQENPGSVELGGDGKYATNVWNVSKATVVTVSKKNVTVQTVGNNELKTYETTGSACDRVVMTTRLGHVYNCIVYRYE